jgi:predicted ATP-dependent endonuclease of OLD family
MWIRNVSVYNHKSIKDSGVVRLEKGLTCLVGMTGTGKTSFLEGIRLLDPKVVPKESELFRGSDISQNIANGSLAASSVKVVEAKLELDQSDTKELPTLTDNESLPEITLNRYLDGHFTIFLNDNEIKAASLDSTAIKRIVEELRNNFRNAMNRNLNNVRAHEGNFNNALDTFEKTNFGDNRESELSIRSLRNSLVSIPKDSQFQMDYDHRIKEIENMISEEREKLSHSPFNAILNNLPNIYYMDRVFNLEDKISLDQYISDPKSSETFSSIALLTQDMLPSGVESVRTKDAQLRISYYETISKKLTDKMSNLWSQQKYDFRVESDNANLTFYVKDLETNATVSVVEGSDGFKWWLAFYMEISSKLSESSKRSVILLDNPATSLHDKGKGDILRLLKDVSKSEKLQLIYTSHEHALIDPWRPDIIRLVEKKTGDGTKIISLNAPTDLSVLTRIREYIGSPARYSLYGGSRTLLFEGITDMDLFLAFNEYLERKGGEKYLSRDLYSVDEIGGISNALDYIKFYKKTGIDFLIIVDSAQKTKHEILDKISNEDKQKYILEISDVIGREGDSEDLIDPELYFLAFSRTVEKGIGFPKSNDNGERKKNVNLCKDIAKENEVEFNKSIVAKQFWHMLNDVSDEVENLPYESLQASIKNIINLIEKISYRFDIR